MSSTSPTPASRAAPVTDTTPYRVMLVDDSAVIRGILARTLENETDIAVAVTASNGEQAVRLLAQTPVDVIVLDIEMPVLDGIGALPRLLAIDPNVKIVMASTLTQRNAEISLKALELGAADYIPKPTATREISAGDEFKRELVARVRNLGIAYRRAASLPMWSGPAETVAVPKPAPKTVALRPFRVQPIEALAVGSSTGGPQALLRFFKGLQTFHKPVLVTQHMPPTFTAILADNIARASGRPCSEARDGETVRPGHVYVAPGNFHMTLMREPARVRIALTQDPPENFCRPSVDPMLRSMVQVWGPSLLTVILTGMGQDGLKGCRAVVEAGGIVVAQDEASSVVWGMPGAVAHDGICSAVKTVEELALFAENIGRGRMP
ncbi:MAG: protein-glutamate methylesterase/protein-glutamine glutaminase [Gemmatimonas sp.]